MRIFTPTIPSFRHLTSFLSLAVLTAIVVHSDLLGADRVRLACGSEEAVNEAFRNISTQASALRHDIKCSINWNGSLQGATGLVKQVNFDDGVRWAVKLVDIGSFHWVQEGFRSLEMIEKYCPGIAIPRQCGESGTLNLANGSLTYYFMEWLEGQELLAKCQYRNSSNEKWSKTSRQIFSIPHCLVSQLAEFVYNLTTCPIPQDEMARLIMYGRGEDIRFENPYATNALPDTSSWVRAQFIRNHRLLEWRPSNEYNGLDLMLLLSWVLEKFPRNEKEPFVLHYWDLRQMNILIDEDTSDLKAVVDWDYVKPVPLRLSALSLRHRMVNGLERHLSPHLLDQEQDNLFLQELARIEKERSDFDTLSTIYANSDENQFIERVLFWTPSINLVFLDVLFPDYFEKAIQRTPEALALAASEWEKLTTTYYRQMERPVPDWPLYVEIQEGLGILGNTPYHRTQRTLKRKLRRQAKFVLETLSEQLSAWSWISRVQCYLDAALSNNYTLPSNRYTNRFLKYSGSTENQYCIEDPKVALRNPSPTIESGT